MDNRPKTHSVCLPTPCQKPVDTMAGPGVSKRPEDARPMADGSGRVDPTQEPFGVGVPIENWRAFERDCACPGGEARSTA